MRSPVTAAKRIAATAAGLRASAASNAIASVASSDGASTRSRGSSRARSMPRTGLECCGRQPHRSNCVKSRDAKPSVRLRCTGARGATARSMSSRVTSAMRSLPMTGRSERSACARYSATVLAAMRPIRTRSRGELAKESVQALGDGRRSCGLFTPAERVSLAGPNGGKLGARAFAHRLEADFRAPGERSPTVSTSPKVVVQNVGLRAGRCDANAESLHGFVPQNDRLRARLRVPDAPLGQPHVGSRVSTMSVRRQNMGARRRTQAQQLHRKK